jgi:pre-mRNA-splicing factor ATP-dependent RNA helicase DHX15/PRP43
MLLREAILDPELSKYAIIVLDEAHERTVDSDVLLALVKGIAQRRVAKPLKIVIMSATLEIPKFQQYFSDLEAVNDESVVKVEGRTFPIEIYHTLEAQ